MASSEKWGGISNRMEIGSLPFKYQFRHFPRKTMELWEKEYQVIQAVTILSPNWRSRFAFERVTFSPSQKGHVLNHLVNGISGKFKPTTSTSGPNGSPQKRYYSQTLCYGHGRYINRGPKLPIKPKGVSIHLGSGRAVPPCSN